MVSRTGGAGRARPTIERGASLGRRAYGKARPPRLAHLGTPPSILGDIAISVETAKRRRPRALEREVERYLIHGLLHLVGHDHARKKDHLRMNRATRRLRRVLDESL